MTNPDGSIIELEGELVRDWWAYEHDDLYIGEVDVMQAIIDALPKRLVENHGSPGYEDSHQKTFFGKVRLRLEVID